MCARQAWGVQVHAVCGTVGFSPVSLKFCFCFSVSLPEFLEACHAATEFRFKESLKE